MPLRRGRKSAAQTPALKSERIQGSKKNPKGSASSSKTAKSITFSDKTIKSLKNKLDEFKEKHKLVCQYADSQTIKTRKSIKNICKNGCIFTFFFALHIYIFFCVVIFSEVIHMKEYK